MAKRRVILCLVMAGILLAGAVPAFASETVQVWFYGGWDYPARVGDSLELRHAWIATTKGQVRVYINHTSESLELLDPHDNIVWKMSAAEWDANWAPLWQFEDADFLLDCPMPTLWRSDWTCVLAGALTEPGDYKLVYTGTFDQPVNDGLHACIDLAPPGWYPPILTPSMYRGTATSVTTIHVE